MPEFFYNCFTDKESYKTAVISCDLAKLEAFGDEYLFEWLHQFAVDRAYRNYVTDCLKMIAENTRRAYGGTAPTQRFAEIISPKPKDTRTAEEIVEDVNRKCGLTMIDDTGGEEYEC